MVIGNEQVPLRAEGPAKTGVGAYRSADIVILDKRTQLHVGRKVQLHTAPKKALIKRSVGKDSYVPFIV